MTCCNKNPANFSKARGLLALIMCPIAACLATPGGDDGDDANEDVADASLAVGSHVEVEPNNSAGAGGVKTMVWGDNHYGTLSAADTVDYWRFNVPARTYINVYLGNIPVGSNYDLYLYKDGVVYWQGTSLGSANEMVVKLDAKAGIYAVKVVAVSNPQSATQYLLRVASTAVSRGYQWVNVAMPYCQAINNAYDNTCKQQCVRTGAAATPEWDPYRSDCSGFVSWMWGIPAPGLTTATLGNSFSSIPSDTLAAGDILLRSGHVVLFERWIDKAAGKAKILEEQQCGKVAMARDVTLSNVGALSTLTLEGATYTARRFNMP